MDVGDWLRRLGLEQYEAAFRENAISDKVLPNLTAEDLKDMGVGLVGHRRILLDAIAALRAPEAAPVPPADASLATHEAKDSAERRQVTVMFSDLVGSTALSSRLDPEDLRDVISAYQKCVGDIVVRFGGFVARYLGDGVLIYFGYPAAHEDDAERAVRAGLALIEAVATLSAKDPLQVRIGVATGMVVVGDLVRSGEGQERGIVGETPNLASRLQGIAEPHMVVIAEATRKLLGNLFVLRDLGLRDIKGLTGPVRAFAALRTSSVASRFEAMHPGGLTAVVGREEELDLLLRRWAKAKTGEGQVVLLSGEAGIGKSRLHAALLERLAAEPHTRMRYFCSPQHTDSAFYPIIGQIERAAGFAHGDTPHTKLDKLDALLARISTPRHHAPLLAEMLSLPNDGRYPALELDPEQRRQKMLEALGLQLEALANSNSVLLILEDVHWSDPTSLEAFGRVVDLIPNLRVLLIITFRPEFEAPWIGQSHVTALTLNRLGHREVGTLIDRVVGNKQLPADVRKDIIERTDGVPLFVEEMTKAVMEAGSELEATRTAAAVSSPVLAVPASLHASLMARLDRLGPAKEVAQVGAAIGREFSHTLLAAVVLAELDLSLSRLIGAGLLSRKGVPPHATYLFKHALVQEAAYGTLLRQPRRALHASIADVLERQFSEIAESQPDLLARHYTEAGLIDKAASLWGKAGLRSLERSALVEALEQLTRALRQIATLPREPAILHEEIKLQVALIYTLQNVKGQAAPETRAAAERALLLIEQAEALGETPDDPLLLFSALYSLWQTYIAGFRGDVARQHAERILALAEKQGAEVPLMHGHAAMGCSLLLTGNLVESLLHYDQVIALCDTVEHRPLKTQLSMDPQVAALIYGSLGRWMLGYPVAAFESAEQGLSKARETGNPAIFLHAIALACLTQLISGNYAIAKQQTDELVELAEQKGSVYWKASGMLRRAGLLALTEKSSEAVSIFSSALGAGRPSGTTLYSPVWLSCLARACGQLGQFDDASSYIGEAITAIETTKEQWYEAEIHRIAGEIALMSPERDVVKAETCFKRALAVARAQQAKSWELRAAISMARLWRERGKRDQARDLLATVYGWFIEGFDTLDLRQAKVLLDELTQVEQENQAFSASPRKR
jgi:class 3 adenylate cyclase/predicted ATPase